MLIGLAQLAALALGVLLFKVERSSWAEGGAGTAPLRTMSLGVTSLAYRSLLPFLSGRRVESSSEIPAKSPREREYVRISALRVTSVAAAASRPFGPAAAAASAPSFTLLLKTASPLRELMRSSTKSGACPPSGNPTLPPSSAIIDGGPQRPLNSHPVPQAKPPRPQHPPHPRPN